jgi:hypothetical protein
MIRRIGSMIGVAGAVGIPVVFGMTHSKKDEEEKKLKWQDTCTRAIRANRLVHELHDKVVKTAPANPVPSMDKLFSPLHVCKARQGQEFIWPGRNADTVDLPCTLLRTFLTLVEQSISDAPDSIKDHPVTLDNLMNTYYYVRLGEIQAETGINVPFHAIATPEKARMLLHKIDPKFHDIYQLQVKKKQEAADDDDYPD